ncbi:YdcF family protein [Pararhizobium sp.]|uniref:YdcF family protein n=1 Tax=Pararhizobium sp. TaxID=1977563 RepID=UPI002716763C|nr:YdcF family protein [Pararhizobium sp.]MDO9417618.1 YdcF family protein [Pararhizobium sp.]
MFIVSKVFWLLAQPLSLAFLAIFLSILCGGANRQRLRGFFAGCAALILFVTLFTTTGPYLLQTLENRFSRPASLPADLSCIIILGGGFDTEVTTSRGGFEMNQGGDRFVEGLLLAQTYPAARIVVSGGDGSLGGTYEGDAVTAARFFSAFGIAPERLLQEDQSRNTFENVRNLKTTLDTAGLSNCVLITSAYHMPRSVGLFRKAGIPVTPWPADYRTEASVALAPDFTQPSRNAQLTTTAMREWIGLFAYFLGGRTHALLPK